MVQTCVNNCEMTDAAVLIFGPGLPTYFPLDWRSDAGPPCRPSVWAMWCQTLGMASAPPVSFPTTGQIYFQNPLFPLKRGIFRRGPLYPIKKITNFKIVTVKDFLAKILTVIVWTSIRGGWRTTRALAVAIFWKQKDYYHVYDHRHQHCHLLHHFHHCEDICDVAIKARPCQNQYVRDHLNNSEFIGAEWTLRDGKERCRPHLWPDNVSPIKHAT